MSDILQEFRETLDVFTLKYSRTVIIDDFNAETQLCDLKKFYELYDLVSLVKQPPCFKNPQNPSYEQLTMTIIVSRMCLKKRLSPCPSKEMVHTAKPNTFYELALNKAILVTKFLKTGSRKSQKAYNKQRNFCLSLDKKSKKRVLQ